MDKELKKRLDGATGRNLSREVALALKSGVSFEELRDDYRVRFDFLLLADLMIFRGIPIEEVLEAGFKVSSDTIGTLIKRRSKSPSEILSLGLKIPPYMVTESVRDYGLTYQEVLKYDLLISGKDLASLIVEEKVTLEEVLASGYKGFDGSSASRLIKMGLWSVEEALAYGIEFNDSSATQLILANLWEVHEAIEAGVPLKEAHYAYRLIEADKWDLEGALDHGIKFGSDEGTYLIEDGLWGIEDALEHGIEFTGVDATELIEDEEWSLAGAMENGVEFDLFSTDRFLRDGMISIEEVVDYEGFSLTGHTFVTYVQDKTLIDTALIDGRVELNFKDASTLIRRGLWTLGDASDFGIRISYRDSEGIKNLILGGEMSIEDALENKVVFTSSEALELIEAGKWSLEGVLETGEVNWSDELQDYLIKNVGEYLNTSIHIVYWATISARIINSLRGNEAIEFLRENDASEIYHLITNLGNEQAFFDSLNQNQVLRNLSREELKEIFKTDPSIYLLISGDKEVDPHLDKVETPLKEGVDLEKDFLVVVSEVLKDSGFKIAHAKELTFGGIISFSNGRGVRGIYSKQKSFVIFGHNGLKDKILEFKLNDDQIDYKIIDSLVNLLIKLNKYYNKGTEVQDLEAWLEELVPSYSHSNFKVEEDHFSYKQISYWPSGDFELDDAMLDYLEHGFYSGRRLQVAKKMTLRQGMIYLATRDRR